MTTILSAIVSGVGVLLAGNLPWAAVLAPLNLHIAPALPWTVVPMAIYLWAYWRYIGGRVGSPSSMESRRQRLRARSLSSAVWSLAIVTGLIGFAALLALVTLMGRVMTMPATAPLQAPPGMPFATMFTLLVMSSVVAGVTEEAGFRGYMQGPIEQDSGLLTAIGVSGAMFGLLHFPNHPNAVLQMLPYYMAVSALYGGLTWATNSILPALALHVGGDVWSLTRLWLTGRPEWEISWTQSGLAGETRLDAGFVTTLAALIALTAITAALCRLLRRVAAADATEELHRGK
jgi:membrane protease YdiL (CAAX protease family)